jgi:hypothetical protein
MHDKQAHEWYEHIHDVLRLEGPPGADLMASVPAIAAMLWQRATMPDLDHSKWDADLRGELKQAGFDHERTDRVIVALNALGVPGKP